MGEEGDEGVLPARRGGGGEEGGGEEGAAGGGALGLRGAEEGAGEAEEAREVVLEGGGDALGKKDWKAVGSNPACVCKALLDATRKLSADLTPGEDCSAESSPQA